MAINLNNFVETLQQKANSTTVDTSERDLLKIVKSLQFAGIAQVEVYTDFASFPPAANLEKKFAFDTATKIIYYSNATNWVPVSTNTVDNLSTVTTTTAVTMPTVAALNTRLNQQIFDLNASIGNSLYIAGDNYIPTATPYVPTKIPFDRPASLSAGGYHTVVKKEDGTVWAWGDNYYNQVSPFDKGNTFNSPVQMGTDSDWNVAEAGYNFNVFKKNNGTLWACGYNSYGEIGQPVYTSVSMPMQCNTQTGFVSLACGYGHTLALKSDGSLWGWGYNDNGQLARPTAGYTAESRIPTVQIGDQPDWSKISAGYYNSTAIKTDGTLWAWGSNVLYNLGLGDNIDRSSPTQVGIDTNWASISSGEIQHAAIKTDGTLWMWGHQSNNGELGIGVNINRGYSTPIQVGSLTDWASVSTGGGLQTIAVKTDGTLWAWGQNSQGQLGLGDTVTRSSPVQVGSLTDWTSVSIGGYGFGMSFGIKTDGSLWAWGLNGTACNLGLGDTVDRSSPTQVGTDTDWASIGEVWNNPVARKTDGTLWTWGENSGYELFYTLGQGSATPDPASTPIQVGAGSNWISAANGLYFSIGVKADGTVWGWGWNNYNRIGMSENKFIPNLMQMGTDTDWDQYACGYEFTLARKTNGTLWACGYNSGGQLGQGDTINHSSFVQIGTDTDWAKVGVIVGSHGSAIKTDGTLWSCGYNNQGQLGQGDTLNRSTPVQIGTLTDWDKIACGNTHSIAVKTNGTLWAWGYNGVGSLGLGDTVDCSSPVQVGTLTDWVKIYGGINNSYAIKANGTLWAWGQNGDGELGLGDTIHRSSPVQVGTLNTWLSMATTEIGFAGVTLPFNLN